MCSIVAIVGQQQWMAHLGISNTAVSTGAVCVAGVATAEVYHFSGF